MKSQGRDNFNVIRAKYAKVGKGNVRLTPSTIYLTQAIASTKSTYSFDVLENQTGTIQANEIRLNQNDEFIMSNLGVYLEGYINTAENKIRLTYAPIESGPAMINLGNLYEGNLRIAVNNIVYLEKWDTKKCEKKGVTQFENFAPASAAFQQTKATAPNVDFGTDGMISVSSLLTLSGAKKNEIVLTLPTALTSGSFSFTDNTNNGSTITIDRIGLRLFGLLAQNGAKFQ